MRLIDADDLEDGKYKTTYRNYQKGWNDAFDAIIKYAPTAAEGCVFNGCAKRRPLPNKENNR